MSVPRVITTLLAALLVLAPAARATWSIIIVDRATGEVAVGSATCLANFNLKLFLPVIVVGKGGAVAQSLVDTNAVNRMKIWDGLQAGLHPEQILMLTLEGDNQAQARQYGIVDMTGDVAQFTGTGAGSAKLGVSGQIGSLFVAVQGNVLTGTPVAWQARAAVLSTPGSVADKLMAGMEAARAFGGDGRCSCQTFNPTGCGSPPDSFVKSAHVGFVIVARTGDADGVCINGPGCANGDYYLSLNVKDQLFPDPDPVFQLQDMYAAFKLDMRGRPDGVLSRAQLDADAVLADGTSTRTLSLTLRDIDDKRILHGGHDVEVEHAPDSSAQATIGPVIDHGDGTYSVALVAGRAFGLDRLRVRVTEADDVPDGISATLFPDPELAHRPALLADGTEISGGADDIVFDLQAPSDRAGRLYAVGLSMSGSEPGQSVNGVRLPLNPDSLFAASLPPTPIAFLRNTPGTLDPAAQARASLTADPVQLAAFVGLELQVAFYTYRPIDFASEAIRVTVVP